MASFSISSMVRGCQADDSTGVGAAVGKHVEGGLVQIIVGVLQRFLFQLILEELELFVGNLAERRTACFVIEFCHVISCE